MVRRRDTSPLAFSRRDLRRVFSRGHV